MQNKNVTFVNKKCYNKKDKRVVILIKIAKGQKERKRKKLKNSNTLCKKCYFLEYYINI